MSDIICKICNEKFKSDRSLIYHIKKEHHLKSYEEYYLFVNKIKRPKCLYCEELVSWNRVKKEFNQTCSNRSCVSKYAGKKSSEAVLKKHGVKSVFGLKEVQQKTRKTKQELYNNPNYNNPDKNKETCLERYGVDNGSKVPIVKKKLSKKFDESHNNRLRKSQETFMLNYGVDWNMKNPSINRKTHDSRKYFIRLKIDKLGFDIIEDRFDSFVLKCRKCGVEDEVLRTRINYHYRTDKRLCLNCYPKDRFRSNGEIELIEEIKKIDPKIRIKTNKKMFGYEADIYVPEKNLVIEYNGVYWHSELFCSKEYHIKKKEAFNKHGIDLIYIWEDDWKDEVKKPIILLNISTLLGNTKDINNYDCEIKEVCKNEACLFLLKNNLNEEVISDINLGLYFNNELVYIVTFKKETKDSGNCSWVLVNKCHKCGMLVIDGVKRLVSYFEENFSDRLTIRIDNDWKLLNEYNEFEIIERSDSEYVVIDGKRKLVESTQNSKDLVDKKYYKLYGSGNLLFKYRRI